MRSKTSLKVDSESATQGFGLMAMLLLIILAMLFGHSFLPGEIVFSNDGPYGAINSAAGRLPSGFKGLWQDLNWFGGESVSASPDLSNTLALLLRPLGFSKFYCPIALFIVGLSAWVFLRRLRLAAVACVVAGMAAMLNSDFFSTAAWGLASQPICFGANFLAMAAVSRESSSRHPWLWTMVAGFCVGWGVMEAFDIGAIFSIFTGAYILFQSWNTMDSAPNSKKLGLGVARVALVTACAGFIAAHTLNILIGTQIKGVAGTAQDKKTKEEKWDFATQWSVPKKEIAQVLIPGVFGYRTDSLGGSNYWGEIGQDPVIPKVIKVRDTAPDERSREQAAQFLAQYTQASSSAWRFSGSGFYAGVLVLVVACWGVCQAFRKKDSPFSLIQRRSIWFWLVVAIVGVLMGFGKYAILYRLYYFLPYVSTTRDPTKFMHVFSLALIVLFAYGLHGLYQTYLQSPNARGKTPWDWSKMSIFDRRWLAGLFVVLGVSVLGWMLYASRTCRAQLEAYMAGVGFDPASAHAMAGYSITAVGWFVLLLFASSSLMWLIFSGQFAGKGARLACVLLGAMVLFDLGRANLSWIVYWDVGYKYASNPIIDLLRDKPYEHRVTVLPYGGGRQVDLLNAVYTIEWVQQMFPCYNIQCLDVVQEPRVPQDKATFLSALPYQRERPFNLLRTWELTNTRYLLGLGDGMVDALNQQIDPAGKRFRLVQPFNIVQKPEAPKDTGLYPVDFTAVPATNGEFGVIEFTGALPRASLYSNWKVNTNDEATLKLLASPDFDPHKTVLVANSIPAPPPGNANQPPGTVSIKPNYEPKRMELEADVKSPSVLLLNDKFSPQWRVTVNGQPAELLRCNYVVRGVFLAPGHYDIVFRHEVPLTTFYVSTLAALMAVGLSLWLGLDGRREAQSTAGGTKRAGTSSTTKAAKLNRPGV